MNTRNPPGPGALPMPSRRLFVQGLAAGGVVAGIAAVGVPFKSFDGNGRAELEALPKDTALAFLCHHGGRSAQAAEQFRALGFSKVFNVTGGINAWSEEVDNGVPKY